MNVLLLEPYMTGSHQAWAQGYRRHSQHEVTLLTLQGQFWKWRMHGGAVTLARQFMASDLEPDLILASDMLDLTSFLALTRERTANVPTALYMHENQLTYPTRPGEKRDLHYGFINYASMLCANRVLFNSQYHLDAWFDELPRLLKHFPDHTELPTVDQLRQRSQVLPLGLDLSSLDKARPATEREGPPLIVWNHRWEYDKNPEAFFRALYALSERGYPFEVAVLGERFVRIPPAFVEAQERLGERIVQFGYAESRAEYARWLWESDITISAAHHDFFGIAVVEALYCDCYPLLANRLAYPQFVPEEIRERCLFDSEEELLDKLVGTVENIDETRHTSLRSSVAHYDWSAITPRYDNAFAAML